MWHIDVEGFHSAACLYIHKRNNFMWATCRFYELEDKYRPAEKCNLIVSCASYNTTHLSKHLKKQEAEYREYSCYWIKSWFEAEDTACEFKKRQISLWWKEDQDDYLKAQCLLL